MCSHNNIEERFGSDLLLLDTARVIYILDYVFTYVGWGYVLVMSRFWIKGGQLGPVLVTLRFWIKGGQLGTRVSDVTFFGSKEFC